MKLKLSLKKGVCFDRNLNSLATTSNFCFPSKIGVKKHEYAAKKSCGENLVLDS